MAHVATSLATESLQWLLDNRACHHVTVDLNNLTLHAPYDSPDDIVIGDGTRLHTWTKMSLNIDDISSIFRLLGHPDTIFANKSHFFGKIGKNRSISVIYRRYLDISPISR